MKRKQQYTMNIHKVHNTRATPGSARLFFFFKNCIIIQKFSCDFWLKNWENLMKQLPGKLLLTDWYTEWRMSFRWPSILLLQLKSKTCSKSIMGKIADWVTTNRLIVSKVTWYFYITLMQELRKSNLEKIRG